MHDEGTLCYVFFLWKKYTQLRDILGVFSRFETTPVRLGVKLTRSAREALLVHFWTRFNKHS